jgi:hypothetical protein
MSECMVTVNGPNDGPAMEWRGLHNQVRAHWRAYVGNDRDIDFLGDDLELAMRTVKTWWCHSEDVPAVVAKLSAQWVGKEVRVFNLAEVHVAKVGQTISKTVTKDGVLPNL